jgi:hypothetical protein
MASAKILLVMLDEDARRLIGKALQAAGFEPEIPAEVGADGLPRFWRIPAIRGFGLPGWQGCGCWAVPLGSSAPW